MDLATVLAALVAALIAVSGYFLFNGVPGFGSTTEPRRRTRRP